MLKWRLGWSFTAKFVSILATIVWKVFVLSKNLEQIYDKKTPHISYEKWISVKFAQTLLSSSFCYSEQKFSWSLCPFPIVSNWHGVRFLLCPINIVSDCHCVRFLLCPIYFVRNWDTPGKTVVKCYKTQIVFARLKISVK